MILVGVLALAVLGGGFYWATREKGDATPSGSVAQTGSEAEGAGTSGRSSPDPPQPADPEWEAQLAKYRQEGDPSRRPDALAPLAELVCRQPEVRRPKYLDLWRAALAGAPRFGAGDLVAEARFYRSLRGGLRRIRDCAAGRSAEATKEIERCEKLLPLS